MSTIEEPKCSRCGIVLDEKTGTGPLCGWCECDDRNARRRASGAEQAALGRAHGSASYTREKPTQPGWYWCRNEGDNPLHEWEAVVRIDSTRIGLVCSFMTGQGTADTMHENEWSEKALWSGPILHPQPWPNEKVERP